jgi:hypothetical protein
MGLRSQACRIRAFPTAARTRATRDHESRHRRAAADFFGRANLTGELVCCVCGVNQIQAPAGSTPRTRFWCRECCALLSVARNLADLRKVELPAEWPWTHSKPKEILAGFLALCGSHEHRCEKSWTLPRTRQSATGTIPCYRRPTISDIWPSILFR